MTRDVMLFHLLVENEADSLTLYRQLAKGMLKYLDVNIVKLALESEGSIIQQF